MIYFLTIGDEKSETSKANLTLTQQSTGNGILEAVNSKRDCATAGQTNS